MSKSETVIYSPQGRKEKIMYQKEKEVEAIEVPYESYLFLQEECHRQRSENGKPLSENFKKRLQYNLSSNGTKKLHDYDLGGCIGDPHHAWEEHRWTSWSVKDMMAMLDKANLPYKYIGKDTIILISI